MAKKSVIKIEEGKYAIGVQALQKETNEPSAMTEYLAESAIVTNQDGVLTLTIMLEGQKTITGFQVENQEAIDKQINEETNRRFEMFELDRLTTPLHAQVQYEIEHEGQTMKGDEALRLAFDEGSLEKLDSNVE